MKVNPYHSSSINGLATPPFFFKVIRSRIGEEK